MQSQQPTVTRDEIREQIRQAIEQSIQEARVSMQEPGGAAGVAPVGVPMTQPPWMDPPADMPIRVQETAIAFFLTVAAIIIGYPIARAIARRIDRTGTVAKMPTEVTAELRQLNQAVEAIAVEVERISEGQRFTTKLLSEQHRLPGTDRIA